MGMIRFVKPALFVYECVRIVFLAVYTLFQPSDPAGFPRFIYTAPAVLFPLMALFIWLDISRYRVYLPLFAAGKCIGLFLIVCWSLITRFTAAVEPYGAAMAKWVMLSGDMLAVAAVLFIIKNDNDKLIETQALEEN